MLSVGNAAVGSGSSLSLDTRAAAGAAVLAANTNVSSGPADVVTLSLPDQRAPAVPTYNAFEFIYRSDFGKIILREQNVETGQEVTQVPSEYHLQQYAATQRAQRVQLQARLLHLETGGSQPHQGTGAKAVTSTAATGKAAATTGSTGQGAPAPQPASAPAPAPQAAAPTAPVVAAAAAVAHVDIKV